MLLLLLVVFLNPVASYGSRAIDDPFEYPSKIYIPGGAQQKNFVHSNKFRNELGKDEVDYYNCQLSDDPLRPIQMHPGHSIQVDSFEWKCVRTRDNGKLSAEPFKCLYKDEYENNVAMIPGESIETNNGSIRHYCDFANGGLRRDTEFVPGCFHNGTILTVGETWTEENPGDKNSSHSIMMECQRGESGYFEKKVLACIFTSVSYSWGGKYLENGTYIGIPEAHNYNDYLELNEVRILSETEGEDREMKRCVETEPGHVAVVKAAEEEVGCTHKNQFHKYSSYWKDVEMGAVLQCVQNRKIEKKKCLVNGTEYNIHPLLEQKLSNGCTFICNDQKNIYKCPDQLKYMEVMKTATTRIPTALRADLEF